jgi:hypothetical protein
MHLESRSSFFERKIGCPRTSLSSEQGQKDADGSADEPEGTLKYHAKREGHLFKRIILFSHAEEVLHSLNGDNVLAKDFKSVVAVVRNPIVQDALVQPFRFMGKSYMVQCCYPEQLLAYGRSNGSHPADSEGFCIMGGRDVYAVAVFQYPVTTARAVPTLHRIVDALGYQLVGFKTGKTTTKDPPDKGGASDSPKERVVDDTRLIGITEDNGPHEKRGISL